MALTEPESLKPSTKFHVIYSLHTDQFLLPEPDFSPSNFPSFAFLDSGSLIRLSVYQECFIFSKLLFSIIYTSRKPSPFTSWKIEWEKMEVVTDFLFSDPKITVDGDCSHEIRRHWFLGRKAMTNLDSVFNSRDITLLTKAHIVNPMVFPVVTHGCQSWTLMKAERQRIDAFEL